MKVKLTKISRPDVEGGLRTNSVEGTCHNIPTVGNHFTMVAPPLEFGNMRCVSTNIVDKVDPVSDNTYRFETRTGSVYEAEILQ